MKPKISLITLGVADITKSLEFYRSLGLKTHNYKESDEIVFFPMEATWLALFPREKLASDASLSPEGTGFGGITLSHNVGSKIEVDTVFAQATSVGAKVIKKPQTTSWGGYSGYFADPDGYLWEVAFNPFMDLT